jgi:carbamoyl-phosphate synthase large subunit
MVVPTIDTELLVLSQNATRFKEAGIDVIIASPDFISLCRDKRKTNGFFAANGISVPKAVDKHNPTFPLFIKPYDGSLSADTYLIRGAEELHEHHLANERFLFMEYICKSENDEYTIDVYYGRDHRVKSIVPRKRLHIRAGEVNKGLTVKNAIVPFLKERLGHIPGAIGCLTVQLFFHRLSGSILGIEINPRFGGGYPLSYRAGANFPAMLIEEYYLQNSIEYSDHWESDLLMLRYDDEVLIHDYQAEA